MIVIGLQAGLLIFCIILGRCFIRGQLLPAQVVNAYIVVQPKNGMRWSLDLYPAGQNIARGRTGRLYQNIGTAPDRVRRAFDAMFRVMRA
jgi:hypothetical protein